MRFFFALLLLVPAVACSIPSVAVQALSAQTPATGVQAYQSVSGAGGATFHVPADWQNVTPVTGAPALNLQYQSPDEAETARVYAGTGSAADASDTIERLLFYLQTQYAGNRDFQVRAALDASGWVAGADSAAAAVFGYADPQGTPHTGGIVLALKGDSAVTFVEDVPADWATQHADVFETVLSSFSLTP